MVAFVDDDCLLAQDWIAQARVFAHDHPHAGAFGGKVTLLWQCSPTPAALRRSNYLGEQLLGGRSRLLATDTVCGAGLAIRTEALQACGWLDSALLVDRRGKSLSTGGDLEIVLRIRAAGYEVWYNPQMCLTHVIPEFRTDVRYLARLMRSNALIALLIDRIRGHDTSRRRAAMVVASQLCCVALFAPALLAARVARQPDMIGELQIRLWQHVGRLEAAARWLVMAHHARLIWTDRANADGPLRPGRCQ